MTLHRGAQRAALAACIAVLAAIYAAAWFLPGAGLFQDGAIHLVTARALAAGHGYTIDSLPHPLPETRFPPFFAVLLAGFTLVSTHAQWVRILPLGCTAVWLWLTRKLLLKLGASKNGALLLLLVTAASPAVLFESTHLAPESLFGLLIAAALLMLLEERALPAGLFAGLGTLTQVSGSALIVACILILVSQRRFRNAAVFALGAMVIVAPWFGWSLAHMTHDADFTARVSRTTTIFSGGLAANEKVVVLSHNLVDLLASPNALLTGFASGWSAIATVALPLWCLFRRRQILPDLFVALYSLELLLFTRPPERFAAPVLPLFLWMVWRALRLIKAREALAALVVIAMALPVLTDVARLISAYRGGSFAVSDDWGEMSKLYGFIRERTPADSVILANMDALQYLNTGRKAVRGFTPADFELYYAPTPSPVSPDQLTKAIIDSGVNYVVLTPDRALPETASFHRSVEALERGNTIERVQVPGVAPGYQLFRVAAR
ncbi:MAG: glycosyltransferase 87 family protein [Acidobacteriota bacterium]|nr:glycosyltransferase 87 family protein [Acidobacteriota bacterium]